MNLAHVKKHLDEHPELLADDPFFDTPALYHQDLAYRIKVNYYWMQHILTDMKTIFVEDELRENLRRG